MNVKEALAELKKGKERKFDQTLDIVINLKGLDLRRDTLNTVINIPHKSKDKKVCAFLEKKSKAIDTITQPEFAKFKDKKVLKNLVKKYDFFFAAPKLMPLVATTFGKVLGPAGKMPSPQLGLIVPETDDRINQELTKVSKAIKVRMKEASIKLSAGKISMPDNQLEENIKAVYDGIVNSLPKKKENVKNVMVKFTMTKPIKVEI